MRRAALVLATIALAVLLASGVAGAIINGKPDGQRHPYVGALVTKLDGENVAICTGIYRDVRHRATVSLINTDNRVADMFVRLSGVSAGRGGQGTCFGDSGGRSSCPTRGRWWPTTRSSPTSAAPV
jgi:hypothetical protein